MPEIPRKLLLATDLSCRCDRAFDRAAALAREWGARLVVLHVQEGEGAGYPAPSWRARVDPSLLATQRVREDLAAHGLEGDVVLDRGEPAERIAAVAEQLGCDLIVTGVARAATFGRALLGTTVDKLLRARRAPLLVVKSRPRRPYRSVLAATDFSPRSGAALEAVLTLFSAADVTLFHAYEVPNALLLDDVERARAEMAKRCVEEARAQIAATPAARASDRVTVRCEHGSPGDLVGELVLTRGIDLVVIGATGRSALASALLGSVAGELVSDLPGDVLVV